MTNAVHPKAGAAALAGAAGYLAVAILQSLHGVTVSSDLAAAIVAFTAATGSYLAPSSDVVSAAPPETIVPAPLPAAPVRLTPVPAPTVDESPAAPQPPLVSVPPPTPPVENA